MGAGDGCVVVYQWGPSWLPAPVGLLCWGFVGVFSPSAAAADQAVCAKLTRGDFDLSTGGSSQ